MVETKMAAPHVRQIREDVVFGYLDFAVLHILGMDKFDGAQYAHFFQKDGADQAVKIAASQESEFLCFGAHIRPQPLIGGTNPDL
jgi:hypothetical protein